MTPAGFVFADDHNVDPREWAGLMDVVGWGRGGETNDEELAVIARAIAAHSHIGHCRDADGRLAGYLSVFSDGIATVILSELVVRPDCQRLGIGGELVDPALRCFAGIPVYAMPFRDSGEALLLKRGFRFLQRPMSVVSMRKLRPN